MAMIIGGRRGNLCVRGCGCDRGAGERMRCPAAGFWPALLAHGILVMGRRGPAVAAAEQATTDLDLRNEGRFSPRVR